MQPETLLRCRKAGYAGGRGRGELLKEVVADLRGDPAFMNGVCHWQVLPARDARTRPFAPAVDARLRAALQRRGIAAWYTHQERCFELARAGRNVVLVTPTASGKTLAYNLPILQQCIEQADACALYLFPTKALAQDQRHELEGLVRDAGLRLPVATYDGDTPTSARRAIRARARLVISNPDMLHTAVLPHHPQWERFFRGLRFVVIDELHTYRGIFGSHFTNVLRRLRRLTAFYGVRPRFLCCSATIGNPRQLAERVVGQPVELISDNGAASGERHFVLYNPPLVDREQGIRRSVVLEARSVAARLLRRGIKTIVFARSRARTELLAAYIRDALRRGVRDDDGGDGDPAGERLASYRGGYLPSERRAIERGLRDGALDGVVATTALELGIDIGSLDASVLAGFPGTIAAAWQQAGRAGRRNATALSILIASASPIDQFIIRHPEYFFAGSPESGWVDPDNIYVLLGHVRCSVFELPFADAELREGGARSAPIGTAGAALGSDDGGAPISTDGGTPIRTDGSEPIGNDGLAPFGGAAGELLRHLRERGEVRATAGRWHWTDSSYPAEQVSLRTATSAGVAIIDVTGGRRQVIGEMDLPSAKTMLFDGAIYLHHGVSFMVTGLDPDRRHCSVEQTDAGYFTEAIVQTELTIERRERDELRAELGLLLADIRVVRRATGFRKLRYGTHEKIGTGDIELPADEMHTCSVVLHFPPATAGGAYLARCGAPQRSFVVEGMAALLHNVAPLFLLCDPGDIGVAARPRDAELHCPAVYVYDACPGGSGLAAGLHGQLAGVLDGCRELLAACPCGAGCPSCIGPPAMLPSGALAAAADGEPDNGKERLLDALAHLHPGAAAAETRVAAWVEEWA